MSYLFSGQQVGILAFCVSECERQQTTPSAVLGMLDAYEYAMQWVAGIPGQRITISTICALGIRVDDRNKQGFRKGPAVFMQGGEALAPEHIGRQLDLLIEAPRDRVGGLNSYEWTRRFLEIHPFQDGNGRVAAILFNLLEGTILNPQPLPAFLWNGVAEVS